MLERIKNLFRKKQNPVEEPYIEKADDMYDDLKCNILSVKIGDDLTLKQEVIENIFSEIRMEIKNECGFIIPEIQIINDFVLQENQLVFYVRDDEVINEFLIPNEDGIREELYYAAKTAIYNNINKIFTSEIAEKYINTVQMTNSWLVWDLTRYLTVIDLRIIMLDIINNGKSINNIGYVFEKIGEHIFTELNRTDYWYRKYNPHEIAKEVAKLL